MKTSLGSRRPFPLVLIILAGLSPRIADSAPGDVALSNYFRAETKRLEEGCLAEVKSLADWDRPRYREELFEMLSLSPLPARGDLKPVVTGRVETGTFVVENVHFQSSPGLYVTANLYLPKGLTQPAPTILYLSGHGPVISNGVSYGNKVTYQHHGAWFARNGYVCLVLDSLQLGEILGLHHGTHREGLWWWNARGYTPAGVEAWNCIRALDYLATRREVDTNRFGATGRSGGGAYSWWIAALDDRIAAVAPVAGITDLENHVVDGTVEGHCDCMFTVNTYRWDYPQVAALVAPRPLLIVNTDADSIFPLDGVQRTHAVVRRIYGLHKAKDKLGLVIAPGPHKDTQDLQVPVFRWFNKHLKGEDPVIEMAATKFFAPHQLKVFAALPGDSINTNVHEAFVPAAKAPTVPKSKGEWEQQRDEWMTALRQKVFRGWPAQGAPLRLEQAFSKSRNGLTLEAYEFDSEPGVRLRLYLAQRNGMDRPDRVEMIVLNDVGQASSLSRGDNGVTATPDPGVNNSSSTDQDRLEACPAFAEWLAAMRTGFGDELAAELAAASPSAEVDERAATQLRQYLQTNSVTVVWVAPRGIGLTAWNTDPRKQVQIRRRFMLLGQTLDSMRVWDIRRACQAVSQLPRTQSAKLTVSGRDAMGVNVAYAALFEPAINRVVLRSPSKSHRDGPDYLNVLRFIDVPQAVALLAERSRVTVISDTPNDWSFVSETAARMSWTDRLEVQGNQ